MRGAIHIPCLDGEQDSALVSGSIAFIEKTLEKGRIILDYAGAAPKLDPLAPCGIEQEQECAIVFGKIRKCNVLPVAPVIGKTDRAIVDDFDKARPAAVLQIGRAIRCCCG